MSDVMMRKALVFGLIAPLWVAGIASDAAENSAAAPEGGAIPVVSGKGSLTIAGGDYWHRQIYSDGEQPALSAFTDSGESLPDGVYRYEYHALPAQSGSATQRTTGSLRVPPDRSATRQVISGRFEIKEGVLVPH